MRVLENKLQGDLLFSVPTLLAALSDMPHNEVVPALLEIAENAEQKRRALIRKALVTMTLFLLLWVVRLPLIFTPLQHKTWFLILGALLNAVPLFGINLAGFVFSPRKVLKTTQNAVAALLLCPQEPRFLPHLVDGLHVPKAPEWKTMLYPTLTAALWDAKSDDIALRLDTPRRAALRVFVAYDFPVSLLARSKTQVSTHFDNATTDLTVAAMRTLAALGDKKTVKVLERIIRTESDLRNETVVRDAAREFLPVLQERIEENEEVFRRLQTLASDQTENPDAVIAIKTYVDTLPPETAPIALAEYLIQQKQNAAWSRVFAAIGLFVAVAMIALIYFVLGRIMEAGLVGILSATTSILASFCTSMLRWPLEERPAGKIAYELANRSGDDTRLLPALLHALRPIVDKKQSDAVQKAVLHLLPLLRTGDATLVPPNVRRPLRAWLTMPRGVLGRTAKTRTLVALDALDALAMVGDTASLRRVEAVTRYVSHSLGGGILQETAERCLEALKLRKPLA